MDASECGYRFIACASASSKVIFTHGKVTGVAKVTMGLVQSFSFYVPTTNCAREVVCV